MFTPMPTASATTNSPLQITSDHAVFFHENGYLVVEDALTESEVEQLRHETTQICRGERGDVAELPPFLPEESDDAIIQRTLCVHFPHKISEIMFDILTHPVIVDGLTQIIGPNVKCMQSMLFIKSAGKPGQAWHQDEAFIPTRDRTLTGAWIALDDATIENGCLWVIPGSHRRGVIYPSREHQDERFDCVTEAYQFPYSDDDAVPLEAKAGSTVFFNGYILHRSLPNQASSGYRRALVNHYMSAESLLRWGGATQDYRDIVMIAGEDPYAYKGIEEISFSHIRPSREGGCRWPTKEQPQTL